MNHFWALCAVLATHRAAARNVQRVSFFSPVHSGIELSKLALPWALMRTQYPLTQLFVSVTGPNTQNARGIRALCSALGRCDVVYEAREDIFARHDDDPYVHVNGRAGMHRIFAMYRAVSLASRTNLLVLLQPDCLVRGRIPLSVLRACSADSAAVCSHHQPNNIMESHLIEAVRTHRGKKPYPTHYSFTCGSIWKRKHGLDIFTPEMADKLSATDCRYDDACIGCAIAIANHTRLVSNHIADWHYGEHDNMTPILHADKRHYARGWQVLPAGVCPLYEELRVAFETLGVK